MKAPSDGARIRDREAADVTRRHENERQRAAAEVAERNRKAHEAAVKARREREYVRT